jgi:Ras-related protein Rab-7A
LVGNKIDLDGGNKRMVSFLDVQTFRYKFEMLCNRFVAFPQVSEKKAREWCASKGDIPYFETSAKEDHNVDTAFLCVAKLALAHEHDQDM